MFEKLAPVSFCVCEHKSDNSAVPVATAATSSATRSKMIDTQVPTCNPHEESQLKDAHLDVKPSNDLIITSVNNENDNVNAVTPTEDNRKDGVGAQEVCLKNELNVANSRFKCDFNSNNNSPLPSPTRHRSHLSKLMTGVANGKRSPKSIDVRKEEVMAIRNRFPTKVPIIVQRFSKETALPQLDKSKYLVPQEITMSQFLTIIRNRMRISSTQTLYLLVNNRSMISLSLTLAEVYSEYAGVDGFLYVTYASQEVFGNDQSLVLQIPSTIHDAHKSQPESNPFTKSTQMNVNESHFDAFLDNTYKSMCFG